MKPEELLDIYNRKNSEIKLEIDKLEKQIVCLRDTLHRAEQDVYRYISDWVKNEK